MSYYSHLHLEKEPFSTSPDPAFFYRSYVHDSSLKRLEIAIRLKRGMSLILGDVGTGKTTLSRALLQNFKDDGEFIFHIVLDPNYKSEFQFLASLIRMFGISPSIKSTLDYKQAIEHYLFQKVVEEHKTVVLLIDEGQKLSAANLEILRTLLNYETNEYKLLQLVIFSQLEFLSRIKKIKNFYDRITLSYVINPLSLQETREMIDFRLHQAGYHNGNGKLLFNDDAIQNIYDYSQGYPRRISRICHDALEFIVMHEKESVDSQVMQEIIHHQL
ncbi:MAG: hypothetical protein A2Y00_06700 [Omnitrophica WOR_2 bacterium GWF2_43_52]|nr:MAG: hypothetical protein A2062_06940 [Omnitrophica WOR_2 bacterium GWA2_44_7]OGX17314.1 MAG: hypothetical protein A2Y01_05875 [Omnitrophica WOR_2 bacterium GWC2_44_8]OGX21841.1 MAG: hypothetical protein A2Y00_06700 [Omnitrophica WOR_2 bacterium GWF2_43_52]OGX54181.1 MAG: hypothetical protein A2460_02750 [Omnitrophica WOR_2 bacterium RIFOXYC2_FULL_43_9]HAH21697.1 transposase [Candidatus Omnitrophota bacterium]